MIFPTASLTPRPIRLSEEIRDWAWRSMHGEYGDDALTHMSVTLDDIEGFDQLPEIDQQDIAIRRIAENAPLRICEFPIGVIKEENSPKEFFSNPKDERLKEFLSKVL